MKNEEIMKYFEYHNAQADLHARRYYGFDYAQLTPFMQAIVDDNIAEEWMNAEYPQK